MHDIIFSHGDVEIGTLYGWIGVVALHGGATALCDTKRYLNKLFIVCISTEWKVSTWLRDLPALVALQNVVIT